MEIVRLLLEMGADINADVNQACPEYFGMSALFVASQNGHIEIVRLLLEVGADVNAQNGKYGTALHGASSRWHMDVVRLLLDNGARAQEENITT
jgi:ankyrin repeat protein